MLKWIEQNKLLFAVIILLVVANGYFICLMLTDKPGDVAAAPVVNQTPVQVNNISNSDGFSVNGNVTNVGTTKVVNPVKTQVVTQTVEKTVDNSAGITGTTYNPEDGG